MAYVPLPALAAAVDHRGAFVPATGLSLPMALVRCGLDAGRCGGGGVLLFSCWTRHGFSPSLGNHRCLKCASDCSDFIYGMRSAVIQAMGSGLILDAGKTLGNSA